MLLLDGQAAWIFQLHHTLHELDRSPNIREREWSGMSPADWIRLGSVDQMDAAKDCRLDTKGPQRLPIYFDPFSGVKGLTVWSDDFDESTWFIAWRSVEVDVDVFSFHVGASKCM